MIRPSGELLLEALVYLFLDELSLVDVQGSHLNTLFPSSVERFQQVQIEFATYFVASNTTW